MLWPAKLVRTCYYFLLPATKRLSLMGWVLVEMFSKATHMCHSFFKQNKDNVNCSIQKVGIGSNHKSPFTLIFCMLKGGNLKILFIPPTLLQSGRFTIYFFLLGPTEKYWPCWHVVAVTWLCLFMFWKLILKEKKSKRSRRSVKSITFVGTSSALTLGHFR